MDDTPRIPAARWVIFLGRLYGAVLVVLAAVSLLAALAGRSPDVVVGALLATGSAVAWGVLVRAFAAHRPTAWRLLVGLAAADVLWPVGGWLAGRQVTVPTVVSVVLSTAFLGLLQHRDSRDWVAVGESRAEAAGRPSIARH